MSFVDLHQEAMTLVDEARSAQLSGDKPREIELLREAYGLEHQAANSLEPLSTSEPTRSVLFRSAASLAFRAGDYHEACSLAFDGLNGNSPEDVAAELVDIVNDSKFRLQLTAENLRLVENEITLIVRGPRVSVGLAPAKQTTLILRRVEELLRLKIKEFITDSALGVNWTHRREPVEVFMRHLGDEEFGVVFRMGIHEQLALFFAAPVGETIVTEFMRDIQAVWGVGSDDARRVVTPKFLAAAEKLNPNGRAVTSIEISSIVANEIVSVRIPPKKGPSAQQSVSQNAPNRRRR